MFKTSVVSYPDRSSFPDEQDESGIKMQISYEIWNAKDRSESIDSETREALEEAAHKRILSQLVEGYTEGQLILEFEDRDYLGYWNYN